jgi:hypothetical protein
MTLQSFVKSNWTLLISWLAIIALLWILHVQNAKTTVQVAPPIVDNRADSLADIVDSLHATLLDTRHDYDSLQKASRNGIAIIQVKNAKDISNIRTYSTAQRDSMWATFNP